MVQWSNNPLNDDMREIFSRMGWDFNEESVHHFRILCEAMSIHDERQARYSGLWRLFGYVDSLFNMRSRVSRLIHEFGPHRKEDAAIDEMGVDDAIDLINFSVFFVRNARTANRGPGELTNP